MLIFPSLNHRHIVSCHSTARRWSSVSLLWWAWWISKLYNTNMARNSNRVAIISSSSAAAAATKRRRIILSSTTITDKINTESWCASPTAIERVVMSLLSTSIHLSSPFLPSNSLSAEITTSGSGREGGGFSDDGPGNIFIRGWLGFILLGRYTIYPIHHIGP